MITSRVIPCLLLRGGGLVKTVRFHDPTYLGDPRNVVRIFNEKEVDELALLDIEATPAGRSPNLGLIREIVGEAFMPVAYGGGIASVRDASAVLEVGVEKVVINSAAVASPELVRECADEFGSQSVVVSVDVRSQRRGRYEVATHSGRRGTGLDPVSWAERVEGLGAGELLLNSIDRDGTMAGYDLPLIRRVTASVSIPVIACGGAGSLQDIASAVAEGGASAAAAGSLFVFHGRHRAVLITYPSRADLDRYVRGQDGSDQGARAREAVR